MTHVPFSCSVQAIGEQAIYRSAHMLGKFFSNPSHTALNGAEHAAILEIIDSGLHLFSGTALAIVAPAP